MVTAKKTPAKKTPAKKVANKAPIKATKTPKAPEPTYSMPKEVHDWIERASSTMKHQANQMAQMKEEIEQLKAYKRFAAQKILGMSYE